MFNAQSRDLIDTCGPDNIVIGSSFVVGRTNPSTTLRESASLALYFAGCANASRVSVVDLDTSHSLHVLCELGVALYKQKSSVIQ